MDISLLELTQSEKKNANRIFNIKDFKSIIDKVIAIKRDAIVDQVRTQEELTEVRLKLLGNKEIYQIFEGISSEFQVDNTKPEFDPEDMI